MRYRQIDNPSEEKSSFGGDEDVMTLRVDVAEDGEISPLYAQQLAYENSDAQRGYWSEFQDASEENVYARLLVGEQFTVDGLYEEMSEKGFRDLLATASPVNGDDSRLQVDSSVIEWRAQDFDWEGYPTLNYRDREYGRIHRYVFGNMREEVRENADVSDVTDEELEKFAEFGVLPEKFEDAEHDYPSLQKMLKRGVAYPMAIYGIPFAAEMGASVPMEGYLLFGMGGMAEAGRWQRADTKNRTREEGIEDALHNEHTQREHNRKMRELEEEYVGEGYILEADLDIEREDTPRIPSYLTASFDGLCPRRFREFYTELGQESIASAEFQNIDLTESYTLAIDKLFEASTRELGTSTTNFDAEYWIDDIQIDASRIGELTRYKGKITGAAVSDSPLFEEDLDATTLLEITAMVEEDSVGERFETPAVIKEENNREKDVLKEAEAG